MAHRIPRAAFKHQHFAGRGRTAQLPGGVIQAGRAHQIDITIGR